jgi:gamma-glutamyltranspeptidase/glutathione hydrolase
VVILRIVVSVLLFALLSAAATREPVRTRKAMVVSTEKHATEIGVEVLRKGGNAVDAAVAVGFALSVTHPAAGSLGGGGFMLIRLADGRSTFIDFRERAPAAATRTMYLDSRGTPTGESVLGYRASGVPGSCRGYALALEKYGTWRWPKVVEPAIRLASEGFAVTYEFAQDLRDNQRLPQFPESRRIFLRNGDYLEQGDVLRQRDLAATLKRIAKKGPDEFYTGETARRIAADMERNGGLITLQDMADYRAVERQPATGSYREYEILGAPPPSSGSGVIQMLNILEGSGFEKGGAGSAASIHYVVEAMRRFFADRAEYFGDADFVEIPLEKLLSKDYAKTRRATIDRERVTPSTEIRAGLPTGRESTETTHFSVVDPQGNAVSVTYTINGWYGSGVTATGTGIVLNNEMDDFTAKPGEPNMFGLLQSENNAIEPGKRPLSAMSPTIVTRDGKLVLVLGSPGGPTIINTVLQVITDVLDFGMDLQQAVDFPRFHHQWMPDELRMESYGFSPDTIELLRKRGHKISFVEAMGRVMAIQVGEEWLLGADDSRTEGLAAGF